MARYIKANRKVAEYLKLENDRNRVTDGNYLLWQADMLAFGRLTELPQILEQIGGLALQAHEAKEEQDGTVVRKLPVATDPRFVVDEDPQPETDAPTAVPDNPDADTVEGDTEETEQPDIETPEPDAETESTGTESEENSPATDEEDGEETETTNEEMEA